MINRSFIAVLSAGLMLASGLAAQDLHVAARNNPDSVVLRWAPAQATTWLQGNMLGYRVERFEMDKTSATPPTAVRISPDTLRAWPLEKFRARFPVDHPYAAPAAQAVHGLTFISAAGMGDLRTVANAANELDLRHAFALIFADLDAGVADALGLRWVDRDVKPDGLYLYRIVALDPDHRDTAVIAVNRTLGPEEIPAAPTPQWEELERSVKLRWEVIPGSQAFTAFWIERSANGTEWLGLNRHPYMQGGSAAKPATEFFFTDTTAGYGKAHRYRLRGITPFGETSGPSAAIVAMGRDRTSPPNPVMKEVKDTRGTLTVYWDQPSGASDLKGFRVEKVPTARGSFLPLHTGLLGASVRSFTDTSSYLLGENHYLVYAVDTAGNEAVSMGGYGFLVDSIPPDPPTGLTGSIDSIGVVTVRWTMGSEPDILGYRVFMANAADHEFSNMTPEPIADTTWSDTITLKTLTSRIHYKVVAVDRNFNHSLVSTMLTLRKPDKVAPVAPVFSGFDVSDTAVVLSFVPSSSPDVMRYDLLRQVGQAGERSVIASWTPAEGKRTYRDTDVAGPEFYSYRLVVTDSAGNRTTCSSDALVRVHQRLRKEKMNDVDAHYDAATKSVTISWARPVSPVKHYVVYRAKDDSEPVSIGSATNTATTYSDRDLRGRGSYAYLVKAVYENGGSSPLSRSSQRVDVR